MDSRESPTVRFLGSLVRCALFCFDLHNLADVEGTIQHIH